MRFNISKEFTPKLYSLLKEGIPKQQLSKDVMSGIMIGILALPLAIALSIASGVSPEKGLVTAIVAGFVTAVLGGSRVQVSGPAGAFIIIVSGIVGQYGYDGLITATLMAGLLMIILGLTKLGNLLKFIPYPLIVGFTSGIALIVLTIQVKDFLGLNIAELPNETLARWGAYFSSIDKINWSAFGIATGTLVVTMNFHFITKRVPGSLVAIITATLVVELFHLPVDTIASKFGSISGVIALPSLPDVSFKEVQALIQPAFAIALLGSIESLLSAVVSDGMIGSRHRSNMELIAQGTANMATALFGGMPSTGAIARTATNVKNGARTPIAAITNSIVVLITMLLLMPYAARVPMACLAGILIAVAYNMSEWRNFIKLLKSNKMDILLLLNTFFLTIFFDLVIAIEVGVVLAALMFMKRMSESLEVQSIFDSETKMEFNETLFEDELGEIPDGVMLYEINGPLFFGASQQFQDALTSINQKPKAVVLRMRNVPFVDATGIYRLTKIIETFRKQRIAVVISGVRQSVRDEFVRNNFYSVLPKEQICDNINDSINVVKSLLAQYDTR